jgi:hypothetical protein
MTRLGSELRLSHYDYPVEGRESKSTTTRTARRLIIFIFMAKKMVWIDWKRRLLIVPITE